ncbi:MAG: hypothetical protein LBP23_04365 [Treponema sp.]|jgi:hypothetical protein|nr:hypothetical protein [Treponema sp.]
MKRMVLFLLILGAAALPGAQAQADGDRGPDRRREALTLSGTLALEQGRIVLTAEESAYFVAGLRPLIGFVEGLKEGAAVTIEGTARPGRRGGGIPVLWVRKLTLNGKDYELPRLYRRDGAAHAGGPGRDGRHEGAWGPDRRGHSGGGVCRGRISGRFRGNGPEWYGGGRHGRPGQPGTRRQGPFSD